MVLNPGNCALFLMFVMYMITSKHTNSGHPPMSDTTDATDVKQLVPVDPSTDPATPAALIDRSAFEEDAEWVDQQIEDGANNQTVRTHRYGWDKWIRFCQHKGIPFMPVPVVVIASYIRWLTEEHGHAQNTIDTYLTSLSAAYRDVWVAWGDGRDDRMPRFFRDLEALTTPMNERSGSDTGRPVVSEIRLQQTFEATRREIDAGRWIDPTKGARVKELRKKLRKDASADPERGTNERAPLLLKHLLQMPFDTSSIKDLRDRALLYIGFAGGFRRSELAQVQVSDVLEVPHGHKIRVRRSKTDQEGKGMYKPIPEALDWPTHPVDALNDWLEAAGIESGPLFRGVDRWGNVRDKGISGHSIYRIVRDWMEAIGEDPSEYGAHSLRAGIVTDSKTHGASEDAIMRQTGHKSADVMREYDRFTGIRPEVNALTYIKAPGNA